MEQTPEKQKSKKIQKKKKLKKHFKVKLTKVTLLAGFVTGILVCLC